MNQGVPVLGFVIESTANWRANYIEHANQEALDKFKEKVKRKPISPWRDASDLHGKVAIALPKAFNTNERPGWVRATEAMSAQAGAELARLSQENAELSTHPRRFFCLH